MRSTLFLVAALGLGCRATITEVTVRDPRAVHVMIDGHEVAPNPGVETYDVAGQGTITVERHADGSVTAAHGTQRTELVDSHGTLPAVPDVATSTHMSKSALVRSSLVLSTYSSYVGNSISTSTNYLNVQLQTPWRNVRRVGEHERRDVPAIAGSIAAGLAGIAFGVVMSRNTDLRWVGRALVLGGGLFVAVGTLDAVAPTAASFVEPTGDVTLDELRFERSDGNRVRRERTHALGWIPTLLGLGGIAAAVTLGWIADDNNERVAEHCPQGTCDEIGGQNALERDRYRQSSGLAYAGGGALLSAGIATLFWKSSTNYGPTIAAAPEADRGGLQLVVRF